MSEPTRRAMFGRRAATPSRTLIRGASVITMDPRRTEFETADVLIDNGKVAALGPHLAADGAEIVEAKGMILAPGFVDGHRHVWETALAGRLVKTSKAFRAYGEYVNQKAAVCLTPQDVRLASYVGGLAAIDSGVTTVLDHANVVHTPQKGEAAARGLLDSGIGGVFCYQLSHTPTYGPGAAIPAAQAQAQYDAPADDWHFQHAAKVKAAYFADPAAPLQFGVGLRHAQGVADPASLKAEFDRARALSPRLMTHHAQHVSHLDAAGLLGPDVHLCHGNALSDEELGMMAKAGAKLCSSPMSEFTYDLPAIHARARKAGVAAGIGLDMPLALTPDYLEHVRTAFFGLFRSKSGFDIAKGYKAVDILAYGTIEGARALGMADVTGSIEVGKRADLILMRTERFGFPMIGTPTDKLVNFGTLADIDSVWAAGVRRKAGGRMADIDWAALKQQVRSLQTRVFAKAETITFI